MNRPEYLPARESAAGLRLAKIRFIEDWEAGLNPTVQQYIARHPEFADELADFIMAFVATEKAVAAVPEPEQPTGLSERALERAAARRATQAVLTAQTPTLLDLAKASGISMLNLTKAVNLCNEAALRLVRGEVLDPPRDLIRLLARVLDRAEEEIAAVISKPVPHQVLLTGHHRTIGDEPLAAPTLKQVTFAQLLEECSDLTDEQKQFWQKIMQNEGKD